MLIEPLTLADVDAVHRMGQAESAFEVLPGDSFWTVEQLTKWVQLGEDVLLVAKDEGQVIGFALSTLHRPTGKATWENLYVSHAHRNKGAGKALALGIVEGLRRCGATYICFLVRAENSGEIAYFERIGFQRGHNFLWFGVHP